MKTSSCYFGLWCIISLWASVAVQVSTVHRQPPKVITKARHGLMCRGNATKGDHREYGLLAHHKSGWMMCTEAAQKMQEALNENADASMTIRMANNTVDVCPQQVHVARNPFEMVVSGYLYHMAESERWLNQTFAHVLNHRENQPFPGVNEVFFSSLDDNRISDWLPNAKPRESYPEYLKRVPLASGLLAEYIWASHSSLSAMRAAWDFTDSEVTSMNVCHGDFYEDCDATWQRVLQFWQISPTTRYSQLLHGAKLSCPKVSPRAKNHSSEHMVEKKADLDVEHPPEYEMVKQLRTLDHELLNGTLAELERHIGCAVSGKYKEAA